MPDLATETHGLVREIKGKLEGIENAISNGKSQRGNLFGRVQDLEQTSIRKSECEKLHKELREEIPQVVEHSVNKAMNGRKRSRWLVIKDIILVVLSTSLPILMGYLVWALSQGKFTP